MQRSFLEFPVELIQLIALYLSVREAKLLSQLSIAMFACLDNKFFLNRRDFQHKRIEFIIKATEDAIQLYLAKDKAHPGYKVSWQERLTEIGEDLSGSIGSTFMMFPRLLHPVEQRLSYAHSTTDRVIAYDKGFHRAHCLRHILNNHAIPTDLCLFAIYTFLHEKNGARLKARIRHALACKGGVNFLDYLTQFVKERFGDHLERMRTALLAQVHEHTYDEYATFNSYQDLIRGSWSFFLERLRPKSHPNFKP